MVAVAVIETVKLLSRNVGFILVFLLFFSKERPAINPVTTSPLFITLVDGSQSNNELKRKYKQKNKHEANII